MRLYIDKKSNDEVLSDAKVLKFLPEDDKFFIEVDGANVVEKTGIDEKLIGGGQAAAAVAGAEEAGESEAVEAVEDKAIHGIDIIINHRLNPSYVVVDKASLKLWVKDFLKPIADGMEPARGKRFMAAMTEFYKKIVADFDKWSFYSGESDNAEGTVIFMSYREDGNTPYFVYIADSLRMEKV
eukprot:m.120535 g.120535  ORF g.120535 m.120535 type:complete len:183 (-) comp52081_c0_seq1:248-796(-)